MQEQENTGGEGQTQASLFRAAEYVRMSTEHQQYSTENQADKIREYAARRGIEIIKTYDTRTPISLARHLLSRPHLQSDVDT